MIPVLFERDEVDFQSNGIGQLPNVIESYAYEIGNAEYELALKYPTVNDVDGYPNSIWKELKVTERQILYKPSHSRKPHAFRIYNYEIDSIAQTITVYGRSRAYDLGNNVVKTVNINNQTPQSAMNTMKANLVEPTDFDFYSDMSTTSSTKWEHQSGLSTIMGEEGSLIQYWGGEVLRENTRISLYNRVGKDNVTTLRLGKNIQQLNYDLRTDNMVTAIIPFYRYTPEGENQEEVVVTGNTVKSSKFNNYRLPYYQFVEYNEQDDNVTNLTTLNNAASKWFGEHPNVDEPTLTINVDMVDVAESTEYAELLKSLEQVNVFDTVSVYISEYDIDIVVKVVSLKYDGFNERNLEVELGSASSGLFETFVNPQFDNISKQLNDVRKIGVAAQISADGKNTNYQGSIDPNEAGLVGDDGDIYFRTVGTEKQMWQYQVNQWNLILDTSRIDVVEKEVSTIIAQAETDRTATEQAINQAIIDANAYAEQQTSALKTEVEASNEILDAAIVTAQNRADAAFADAEIAKNNAFAATQTAQTAINDSVTAINNAQTALDSLTTISGDLSDLDQTVQNKFTSIDGQLSNMVTQTTFNALDQKVTSQGTLISQTQSTLLSKADKTVVDTINQTVGQHTTQIEQNAQAITARLTETQINNLLGTKNYVNQTTLTATANGLNASITQVSNDLSNLEIGGRNFLPDSHFFNSSGGWYAANSPLERTGDVISITSTGANASSTRFEHSIILEKGIYTLSLRFKSTSGITLKGFTNVSFIQSTSEYLPDENWVIGKVTFEVIDSFSRTLLRIYLRDGSVGKKAEIDWIKLEKGNKATDWTPAPEDMATLEQFTTIEATIQGLQTTVGNKAEQSQVTQLAGQISSKVESSTYTSKMTQLDSAISQRVTSTTFESRITQLDDSIDLKVSSGIDGLEIGGRNLLLKTASMNVVDYPPTYQINGTKQVFSDGDLPSGHYMRINNFSIGGGSPSFYFTPTSSTFFSESIANKKVTFSLWVRGSKNFYFDSGHLVTTNWTKVSWSITLGTSNYHVYIRDEQLQYVDVSSFKVEYGDKATDWTPATEDIVTQINLSPEGILIAGKRIRLDGDVTMEQAFINRLNTVTLNAVTANITTIRSQVLQANVVTSTHLQTSTATIDKLFATDAMVSRLTAKTAFINSVKAIDIVADRISGGTFNGNNMNVININASSIVANTLSSITANTGALSVNNWVTIVDDNYGIRGTFDAADVVGGAYDPRWFKGEYSLARRYLKFLAEVWEVNSTGGKGNFRGYAESFFGGNYFKMRNYVSKSDTGDGNLMARVDMTAEEFQITNSWSTNGGVVLRADGGIRANYLDLQYGAAYDGFEIRNQGLFVGNLNALDNYANIYFNYNRTDLADFRIGLDGSALNGGRLVSSKAVYNRTYSSAANVVVFDTGTIGRAVSAKKYKLNINEENLLDKALLTLGISPSSWFDKGEVESIAKNLTENTIDSLDENFKLRRHYGFVADEFDEVGATEVVIYDSKGDVEGLAYDRISMYHHVMISDLYKRIEEQDKKIKELEGRIK